MLIDWPIAHELTYYLQGQHFTQGCVQAVSALSSVQGWGRLHKPDYDYIYDYSVHDILDYDYSAH